MISTPTADSLEHSLAQLLEDRLFPIGTTLEFSENLFDAGLDSMGLMQLLVLLEQEYGVTVPDTDLSREHFSSVRHLARFVRARTTPGAVDAR